MRYFKSDFNEFFKELAANNHKEWFDINRERYHNHIKKPFENFIDALVSEIQEFAPEIKVNPRDCIFRINRDIRFTKDKSPYKLNRSAFISLNGRKTSHHPGFYLRIGPENTRIGGGMFKPEKPELQKIRTFIMNHPEKFSKAISRPSFLKVYGHIHGERNKRLPTPELNKAAKKEPFIFNKQYYYLADFPADANTEEEFLSFVIDKYKAAISIHQFLKEAVNV